MDSISTQSQPYEAASQARNFMHTYESQKDAAEQLTRETAKQLEAKNVSLISVIESIGEYVKDEDATIRSKALHYLAGVLDNLPKNFLSRQQLDVICTFLVERIEDGGAVEGLLALQATSRFTKDMAILTTRAVLEGLQDLQIRPQKQRYVIIRLVHELLGNHRDAITSMGTVFLAGVIDLFSGEKDPRNLMLVFSVVLVVATEWDLGSHVEPLFDSVFCYYPITFKPPPNDPYKITAQDLKDRLRQCIAASSEFAQFAFPQLLEKLDSGSPNVKRDVFDTLTACIQSYHARTVAEYSIKLWNTLKYEVFHAQEDDLADGALLVLQHLATKLCSGDLNEIHGTSSTKKFLDTVIKECLEKLKEPQHKQAKSASRILAALGVSSHQALDEVVKAVFPSLMILYQAAETIESRRALLECALIMLEAAEKVSKTIPRSRADDNPLIKFKDSLLEKFSQALMATTAEEMSYRILALNCLAKLSNIPGVLLDEEVGLPVQYFNEIILTEDASGRPDLMNQAVDTLLELSESRYQVLQSITVPKLLAELPDNGSSSIERYQRSIGILARLSTKRELSDIIIRRLFGRLEAALQHTPPAHYCESLLVALTYAIDAQRSTQASIGTTHVQKVRELVKQSAEAAVQQYTSPLTEIGVLRALGRLTCLVLKTSEEESRSTFAAEAYTLFTGQFVLADGAQNNVSRSKTIILSTYILAAVDDKLESLNHPSRIKPTLDCLCQVALATEAPIVQYAILQHLSLLINKFARQDELEKAYATCKEILEQDSHPEIRSSKVRLLMFLSKAQVLRMSNTRPLLDHLFNLLASDYWGNLIASGFEILLSKDEILIKENGAKIRLLAGQVVFSQLLAHIGKVFTSATPEVKSRYLIALGGVLRNIDHSLALSHMKELNPLLLQSLNIPDVALKGATITILAIAITESPALLEEHLSSIITQLITIAVERQTNEASLRLKAMSCLRIVPSKFKEYLLLPHVKAVDRGVVRVLDDPRRDVRKAAVDCRTAWLVLEDPDEDD